VHPAAAGRDARPPGPDDVPPAAPLPRYWDHDATPPAPPAELAVVLSPRPRLRAARIAVWVSAVLGLVDAIVSVWGFDEVRRAIGTEERGGATPLDGLAGEGTSIDALNAALDASSASLIAFGVATIVAAVFVIRWQNVAMHNQRALGVHARYTPVKAGWSWFVPIWWFFGPKRAYDDAWRAAEPEGASTIGRDHFVRRDVPGVFHAWWAFWLVSLLVQLPFGWGEASTLGDQRTAFVTSALSGVAHFIAGPLFVIVLERITARHEERREEGLAALEADRARSGAATA